VKRVIALIVLAIVVLSTLQFGSATVVELDVLQDLDLPALQAQWKAHHTASFINEGINFTIQETTTKVIITVTEKQGRDVDVKVKIPSGYISPSDMGYINSKDNVALEWRAYNNDSMILFSLFAYQQATFEVAKTSLLYGKMKKAVHKLFNYVEYNGQSNGKDQNIVVYVDKSETGFEVDNQHMIVQYKTGFFGWYYPVDSVSSSDVYYYVDDLGTQYRVVTHFKGNTTSDIKIHAFPGASKGFWNWDSIKGGIARSIISLQIGIKKALIDWFGNKAPKEK